MQLAAQLRSWRTLALLSISEFSKVSLSKAAQKSSVLSPFSCSQLSVLPCTAYHQQSRPHPQRSDSSVREASQRTVRKDDFPKIQPFSDLHPERQHPPAEVLQFPAPVLSLV